MCDSLGAMFKSNFEVISLPGGGSITANEKIVWQLSGFGKEDKGKGNSFMP